MNYSSVHQPSKKVNGLGGCSIFPLQESITADVHSEQLPHCTAIAKPRDHPGGMTVSLKAAARAMGIFAGSSHVIRDI